MIENGYVKKKKRKKLAAIAASVGTLGISMLVLISFLGRFTGSFTVSLNKGNVKISLSNKQNFGEGGEEAEVTTYMKVDELKPFDEMTFTSLPKYNLIDNEETTYETIGSSTPNTMDFFKYTFFIKNMGSISADYTLKVRIVESHPSTDGATYLDSLLRVMVFANDGYKKDDHAYTVYAKASESPNKDLDGNDIFKEYISMSPKESQRKGVPFPGFAESFETDDVVCTIPVKYFDQSDINRYTIVTWIEGYDPQSIGKEAPEGANIKLGVEINAYENE